jgi:hypothetical protein
MDLPKSTVVNRFIPKDKFYNKTKLNTKIKQLFTDEIEKITWLNKIAPDTLNISAKKYNELQVFEIKLKSDEINPIVLKHIDASIPYPILYLIKKNNMQKALIFYKDITVSNETKVIVGAYYETGWVKDIKLELKGRNVDEIYKNFFFQIAPTINTENSNSIKNAVESDIQRKKIQKQIDSLNRKIFNEPAFAKRQDMARQRYDLEEQLK